MIQDKLKADLKRLVDSYWPNYESRLKKIVEDLDVQSKKAREISRKQLDYFSKQLKVTRAEIEKRVSDVVQKEAKKLNDRALDLIEYLKKVSASEETPKATPSKTKKRNTGTRKTTRKSRS